MTPLHFTDEFRKQELERGRRSLFYFGKAILGFDWLEDYHADLCAFLEGRPPYKPWGSAAVVMTRGTGKSTIDSMMYPWWRGCYIDNWSGKLVGNSSENIKQNFFVPMVQRFTEGARADYLQWLFQERLPDSLSSWTVSQIRMRQSEPGPPTLSYWGLESRFEGWHGDFVGLDDPEGGEAEKSEAPNEESWAIWSKLPPLAKNAETFQRLLTCTPHGQNPIAYRLRDAEPGDLDNSRRIVQIYWKGIYDERGNSNFPTRFPPRVIPTLKLNPSIWHSQYKLGRPGAEMDLFDFDRIERASWSWADLPKTAVRYRSIGVDEEGALTGEEEVVWPVEALRFFLHVDPKHKLNEMRRYRGSKARPTEAAIAVTAVAPDANVLVMAHWTADCGLDPQVQEMFKLYCRWEAHKISYEAVGAQIWLAEYVDMLEKRDPRYAIPVSVGVLDGVPRALPRMSRRLVECENSNEKKEDAYRAVLAAWLNSGALHLRRGDEKVRTQLQNCLSSAHAVDLLDCLVQGPTVWSAPAGARAEDASFRHRRRLVEQWVGPYSFRGNPRLQEQARAN